MLNVYPVSYILAERQRCGGALPWGRGHPDLSKATILSSLQIRQQMEEQVAQKSSELEQYLQRVRELEDMYLKLQEALEDERQARQDEETVRKLQARCRPVCSLLPRGLCLLSVRTLLEREPEPMCCLAWETLHVGLAGVFLLILGYRSLCLGA